MDKHLLLIIIWGSYVINRRKAVVNSRGSLTPFLLPVDFGIGEYSGKQVISGNRERPPRHGWGSVTGVQLRCHVSDTVGLPHLGLAWPVGSDSVSWFGLLLKNAMVWVAQMASIYLSHYWKLAVWDYGFLVWSLFWVWEHHLLIVSSHSI